MRKSLIFSLLCSFQLFARAQEKASQANADAKESLPSYNLSVSVEEVTLTFHAADAQGLPIDDLKPDEIKLRDNGKPPRKILAFQSLQNFPIHAGILIDTSQSMWTTHPKDQTIAMRYIQRILRQQTDQAFVLKFSLQSTVAQPWTSDLSSLSAGIRNHANTSSEGVRKDGTAIYDAIYRACLNQFGHTDNATSGNFILLFSDGEDNASRSSLQQAVDMCQRTNTAIYTFHPAASPGPSSGPKTLSELTSQTGGRAFYDDDLEDKIDSNLRTIEADLRNQYRVIYKPQELKHDGSFHRVEINAVERLLTISVRSGYYAPLH